MGPRAARCLSLLAGAVVYLLALAACLVAVQEWLIPVDEPAGSDDKLPDVFVGLFVWMWYFPVCQAIAFGVAAFVAGTLFGRLTRRHFGSGAAVTIEASRRRKAVAGR